MGIGDQIIILCTASEGAGGGVRLLAPGEERRGTLFCLVVYAVVLCIMCVCACVRACMRVREYLSVCVLRVCRVDYVLLCILYSTYANEAQRTCLRCPCTPRP